MHGRPLVPHRPATRRSHRLPSSRHPRLPKWLHIQHPRLAGLPYTSARLTRQANGPHDFWSTSCSGDDVNRTCVDLACGGGIVELRDSEGEFNSAGDHRPRFTYAEFNAFQQGLRTGHTDDLLLVIIKQQDGWYEFRSFSPRADGPTLTFNQAEDDAFYHDVLAGHYDVSPRAAACPELLSALEGVTVPVWAPRENLAERTKLRRHR